MSDALYGGEYPVYRGEDRPIPFSPVTPSDITGQTFSVLIVDPLGNQSTISIAHGSLTITVGTGEVTAQLTAAITTALTGNKYRVELWRIDSGHASKLAWIFINVGD